MRLEIVDLEAGIAAIIQAERPVIVICTCKASEGCHTTVIRDELARRGYPIVELRAEPSRQVDSAQIALF